MEKNKEEEEKEKERIVLEECVTFHGSHTQAFSGDSLK